MFVGLIDYLDSVKKRDPAPRSRWEVLLPPVPGGLRGRAKKKRARDHHQATQQCAQHHAATHITRQRHRAPMGPDGLLRLMSIGVGTSPSSATRSRIVRNLRYSNPGPHTRCPFKSTLEFHVFHVVLMIFSNYLS